MTSSESESIGFETNQSRYRKRLSNLLVEVLEMWSERRRQRLALRELSDHVLKDIGLNRSDAEREAAKPFWRG